MKILQVPDKRDPKYMEQKLTELKGETKNLKIIVGDFSIPLYIINRIREKIQNNEDLNTFKPLT